MVNTNSEDLETVKSIAATIKKLVNSKYRLLELEMDGAFKRLLLLTKKKYAALVVHEKGADIETQVETKGLDVVRRDWCGLSHDVSR